MSKRSIRKVTAIARREAYKALKYHIKGLMWVDNVTVDTHLALFSKDYMAYFWSHLASACNNLRTLTDDELCATPNEVSMKLTGCMNPAAESLKIRLTNSVFFLKIYNDRLSCGPSRHGNTVLNVRTDDIAQMIVAYDHETERCAKIVTDAINECNAEAVAMDIALTTAHSIAKDIIEREGIDIEADQAGRTHVHYRVTLRNNPIIEAGFWSSMDDFRARLLHTARYLHHKEEQLFRDGKVKSSLSSSGG